MSTGNQSRTELRKWLAPPNPSINHNTAHDAQHDGTANWFIQGHTFDEWKTNGSLLWIRGNRMLFLPRQTFVTANRLFDSGLWQEYPLVRSYTIIPVVGNLYSCQVRPSSRKSSIFENRYQLSSRTTISTSRMLPNETSGAC